ncbi:hypothetical protein SVIO_100040 [Streptomyces violaceusniger]|uniref:HTH hxlR-type domain-containing protein n=1 Tax=Streptomyces violaceusniger TaxID=68280 RepID=A0A4D4LCR0_STRVO|nr:hypothetical protein SVIO_100040 [Streptomyces violaceusniger]
MVELLLPDLLGHRLEATGGRGRAAEHQTNPVRHEYVPTERGRSLRPVVVALAAWGNRHLAPEERATILVDGPG